MSITFVSSVFHLVASINIKKELNLELEHFNLSLSKGLPLVSSAMSEITLSR